MIKTEKKIQPISKMAMTTKKPVAEVKIDLSSTSGLLRTTKFSIPTKPTMISSRLNSRKNSDAKVNKLSNNINKPK